MCSNCIEHEVFAYWKEYFPAEFAEWLDKNGADGVSWLDWRHEQERIAIQEAKLQEVADKAIEEFLGALPKKVIDQFTSREGSINMKELMLIVNLARCVPLESPHLVPRLSIFSTPVRSMTQLGRPSILQPLHPD